MPNTADLDVLALNFKKQLPYSDATVMARLPLCGKKQSLLEMPIC